MTAEHLAGVLEAIAHALRALPASQSSQAVQAMAAAMAPQAAEVTAPAPAAPEPVQPAPAPAGETMGDWLRTFRTIIRDRGYSAQTLRNRSTCLAYIETSLGARPLRAIKPHEISTMLKGCSAHKAGRVLMEIRDAFVEAIANGAAETNPAAHVKKPASPGIRKRLTLDTWQWMFKQAKEGQQRWVPALLLLALHTGQRRADLAKMRFDDVVDGCLRVEQQKKARKPIGARVAIPLNLRLQATGLSLGEVIELCRGIGAPGEYLLRKQGGGRIEESSLSARFRELIVSVCGEGAYKQFEWPSLHEVRSLSARTYIAEGMAPATVQTLLGHAHAEMTAIYLNDRGLTAGEWKTVEVEAAVN
jgi:enterobacteria phage integrase